MAAIAGFIGGNATEETNSRMLEKIRHRGRTEQNVFRVPGGVVGSVEMANIHRITHSPSPTALLDGVLYNESKNGKPDAEYIKEQFIRAGRNALSGLDGSFSCALIAGNETLLARDSVGARPLIYGLCPDGGLCFASEAKALCGIVDTIRELPPEHVYSTKNGIHPFDEDCIAGFVANYYASRLASEFTETVMVGEGADELFGGYFGEIETDYDETEKESAAKKLMDIAYNTVLRHLDRGCMANNSVGYRIPFLDSAVVAFSEKRPLHMKVLRNREWNRFPSKSGYSGRLSATCSRQK